MKIMLKIILKKRKKSVAWLSKKSGIKYGTLIKIVNNEVYLVRLENIEKICKVLGITMDDLFQ